MKVFERLLRVGSDGYVMGYRDALSACIVASGRGDDAVVNEIKEAQTIERLAEIRVKIFGK